MLAARASAAEDDFSRWESALKRFAASDLTDPPPMGANLFVGSSSIRLWDLPRFFPESTVINRGFGGSQIADSTHFMDRLVLPHRPRVVVLYAGDNDVAAGKSAERVHHDFLAFRAQLQTALPETRLVYVAIKPSIARWQMRETMHDANQRIATTCEEDALLEFVDIWKPMLGDDGRPRPELFVEDGLHLSPTGYRLWAARVRPHLQPPE